MDKQNGYIFNVQRFSIHDGPGIRTVVFMQRCPLHCLWCSNPESQRNVPQLLYFSAKCMHCQKCASVCPYSAIDPDDDTETKIARSKCCLCGRCGDACPTEAITVKGRLVDAREIIMQVEADRIYYGKDGGVTFSGGEPFSQADFLLVLLKEAKKSGINTAVETCGYTDWMAIETTLAFTDCYLYDIKHLSPQKHLEYTGVSNELIINNLERLVQKNADVTVRVPVIPGYNDEVKNIDALARLIKRLSIKKLVLLPYHNFGVQKYYSLGLSYRIPENTVDSSAKTVKKFLERLKSRGVDCLIGE